MKRREFINKAALVAGSVSLSGSAITVPGEEPKSRLLTVKDFQQYLRSLTEVQEPSVDQIIIGNPDAPVKKVGTAWMPYLKTIREAIDKGINLLVAHEPTFYTHLDLQPSDWDYHSAPEPAKTAYFKASGDKQMLIKTHDFSIIRCHDVLDKIPEFGIPFSFGQKLGLPNTDIIAAKTYYNVYRIKPRPAKEFALQVSRQLIALNQPGVAFYGDENRIIERVGLGTGCICNPLDYMDLNADCFIAIDDTIHTWIQTAFAEDTGMPLIVINHGTSEENGMVLLNQHLSRAFPEIEFVHFNQGCSYKWITG
jgi:putative NIF3 family GTP cyclohydrolase 1 type 2